MYAGFGPRALAILVDLVVWVPLFIGFIALRGLSIPAAILAQFLIAVIGVGYPVYFLSRWGQTIGKMVARVKVACLDGSRIAPRHAWLRSSVDIGLTATYFVAVSYVLATWTEPEWSSLNWLDRGGELEKRSSIFTAYDWASSWWSSSSTRSAAHSTISSPAPSS